MLCTPTPFLRPVVPADLPRFFDHQRDPLASHMAAFGTAHPNDRGAFDAHWAHLLTNERIVTRTIEFSGLAVGHVLSFELMGERELSYWIDRSHWGRGIATAAVRLFVAEQTQRPLHARAAKDNVGSIRVLHKCGFVLCGEGRDHAQARGQEVEEFVFCLTD